MRGVKKRDTGERGERKDRERGGRDRVRGERVDGCVRRGGRERVREAERERKR